MSLIFISLLKTLEKEYRLSHKGRKVENFLTFQTGDSRFMKEIRNAWIN